jgi:hypothetical protein
VTRGLLLWPSFHQIDLHQMTVRRATFKLLRAVLRAPAIVSPAAILSAGRVTGNPEVVPGTGDGLGEVAVGSSRSFAQTRRPFSPMGLWELERPFSPMELWRPESPFHPMRLWGPERPFSLMGLRELERPFSFLNSRESCSRRWTPQSHWYDKATYRPCANFGLPGSVILRNALSRSILSKFATAKLNLPKSPFSGNMQSNCPYSLFRRAQYPGLSWIGLCPAVGTTT